MATQSPNSYLQNGASTAVVNRNFNLVGEGTLSINPHRIQDPQSATKIWTFYTIMRILDEREQYEPGIKAKFLRENADALRDMTVNSNATECTRMAFKAIGAPAYVYNDYSLFAAAEKKGVGFWHADKHPQAADFTYWTRAFAKKMNQYAAEQGIADERDYPLHSLLELTADEKLLTPEQQLGAIKSNALITQSHAWNALSEADKIEILKNPVDAQGQALRFSISTSNFRTPAGYGGPLHYSTAYNMAKAMEILRRDYPKQMRFFNNSTTEYYVDSDDHPDGGSPQPGDSDYFERKINLIRSDGSGLFTYCKTGSGKGRYGGTMTKHFVCSRDDYSVAIMASSYDVRDRYLPQVVRAMRGEAITLAQEETPSRPAKPLSVEIDEAISAVKMGSATSYQEMLDIKLSGDLDKLPTAILRQLSELRQALQTTGVYAPESLQRKLDNIPYVPSEPPANPWQRY